MGKIFVVASFFFLRLVSNRKNLNDMKKSKINFFFFCFG